MNHTPGPWRHGGKKLPLAILGSGGEHSPVVARDIISDDDARLIKHAPDMLKILREAQEMNAEVCKILGFVNEKGKIPAAYGRHCRRIERLISMLDGLWVRPRS